MAAEYALVVAGARKTFRSAQRSGPWWSVRPGKAARTVKEIRAVDDISLRIRKGEIYGILGSNGSGKSTLIRLVSTLLLPDAGALTVFGRDVVKHEAEVKRMINRVSVDAAFFKKLSPMENLMYAARLYGLEAAHARAVELDLLAGTGLHGAFVEGALRHPDPVAGHAGELVGHEVGVLDAEAGEDLAGGGLGDRIFADLEVFATRGAARTMLQYNGPAD